MRSSGPSRAVEALHVAMNGGDDELDTAEDGLAEPVGHYADARHCHRTSRPCQAIADVSVSEATWSTTTRSRAASDEAVR